MASPEQRGVLKTDQSHLDSETFGAYVAGGTMLPFSYAGTTMYLIPHALKGGETDFIRFAQSQLSIPQAHRLGEIMNIQHGQYDISVLADADDVHKVAIMPAKTIPIDAFFQEWEAARDRVITSLAILAGDAGLSFDQTRLQRELEAQSLQEYAVEVAQAAQQILKNALTAQATSYKESFRSDNRLTSLRLKHELKKALKEQLKASFPRDELDWILAED